MGAVVRGGTLLTHDLTYTADIGIEDGTIAEIGESLTGDTPDATGAFIIPSGIDLHTHFETPYTGASTVETWESGTFAAASGGPTMIVDHVISAPDDLLGPLALWEERGAQRASIDYGFHMSITGWSRKVREEMATCVDRGVNTVKHFVAHKGALVMNDDEMFASFTRCLDLGAIPLVHAENDDVVAAQQQKLLAEGNRGPEAHACSRTPSLEGEATNRAIADAVGVPVYIVHVSSNDAHEAIRRGRMNGTRLLGEPLVQDLLLDVGEYAHPDWDHAARRVMSPPSRVRRHQNSLWFDLSGGSLLVVATDHCAFTTAQKRMGRGDFTKIPYGTGGLEDRMALLWTHGVIPGRITAQEFVALTSTNIARVLNIYPGKGAILPDADADLVIWDPAATKTISAETQLSAIDYNVFEGFTVTGLPRTTLSRGTVVWGEGARAPQPGRGLHIRRPADSALSRAHSQWRDLFAQGPVARDKGLMPIGV